MKWLTMYEDIGLRNPDAVFNYLSSTLTEAIRTWDYFVNWNKVFANVSNLEIHLNLWNYLLGKNDFDTEFNNLLSRHPEIVIAIPAMVVRDGQNSSAFRVKRPDLTEIDFFDFSRPADTPERIASALEFVKKSGLIRLFSESGIRNLVDYMVGVEAGVDSNGRKNRAGAGMEAILREKIHNICAKRNWQFLEQASAAKINNEWGVEFNTGKSERKFDFAVFADGKVNVIEVNIYNGGGSKLKATAGEFTTLHKNLENTAIQLIWITDGRGWSSTLRPLRDAFEKVDYIFNLKLVTSGCLEEACSQMETRPFSS